MKLFVTILEETCAAAVAAIRALKGDHDGVEVRAERFASIDVRAIRAATEKPIILTYRSQPGVPATGMHIPTAEVLGAGIEFVDVEWREDVEIASPERTVLSHHDYEGMRGVETIMAAM